MMNGKIKNNKNNIFDGQNLLAMNEFYKYDNF